MAMVGRQTEREAFDALLKSGRADFVALYGRRRVGKTFLVRTHVQPRASFYVEITGQRKAKLGVQLLHATESLSAALGVGLPPLESWDQAFRRLTEALEERRDQGPSVVFLDELPWLASRRSGVLEALDYWWNARWSRIPNLTLVACGSAASWMVDKLIQARGGLHNRVTRPMLLRPFSLLETRAFLRSRGSTLGLQSTAKLYMALGGVPFYLNAVRPEHSADQAIDRLCFSPDGILRGEFERLFTSLFEKGEEYERLVRAIASKRSGLSRAEILERTGMTSGGGLARRLRGLEDAGFIARQVSWGRRRREAIYRVVDPFVFFHLKWMEDAPVGLFIQPGYWHSRAATPGWTSWTGFAFETLCMQHVAKVKHALGLAAVPAEAASWRFIPGRGSSSQGAQVDLLFDRADGVVTLCELKFCNEVFALDKATARALMKKMWVFEERTGTRKDVQVAMVTTHGIRPTVWSEGLVSHSITLEDLFGE